MSTQTLTKKIETIEKELKKLAQPKSIIPKMYVDEHLLQHASKAIFDFDIEKYVTPQDVKRWK
jgi:hypothetical protein